MVDRVIEEALPDDFPSNVLPSSLLMVHNSGRSCQDDIPKLTRRQQLNNPLLKVRYPNVVSRRDDASLVDAVAKIS